MNCPCCSGKSYESCCKPYHEGQNSPTAILLMRSRYTAYALGLAEYIIYTTHPKSVFFETEREKWVKEIIQFSEETDFLNLQILDYAPCWVHFVATLRMDGKDYLMNEKSTFKKFDGRWCYFSGIHYDEQPTSITTN